MATIVLSSNIIAEDAAADTTIGTLSVLDGEPGETFIFTLTDEHFKIVNGNELVVASGGFDYEVVKQYLLDIQATGSLSGPITSQPVPVDITNVNEAPTDIQMTGGSIADNANLGATVATLAGIDPDKGDLLTYTIVTDATGSEVRDHPYFEIDGNEIVVKSDLATAPASSSLYVKVTDAKGLFYVKQVTLSVTEANERPDVTFDFKDVLEGAQGGTVVGTLKAVDVENDPVTYTLSEVSANWFSLVKNADGSYNVVVKQGVTLSLGNAEHQSFTVAISDGFNTFNDSFDLNVLENLEPEANFQFNMVPRNAGAGTVVGILVAHDPEGKSVTFTLSDESAALFNLVKNTDGTYNVVVKDGVTLDYDNPDHHVITAKVSDGFNEFDESFQVEFLSIAPTVILTTKQVSEGAGSGVVVGRLAATDPEGDIVSYTLTSESATWFDLVENEDGSCDIVVKDGVTLDYETLAHHSVTVLASDGDNIISKSVAINLLDDVDLVIGTQKNDVLTGTAGRDVIKALNGNDRLSGGTGDDRLYGSLGKDILEGGAGQDVFVFDSKLNKKTNLDKIADFSVADDSIWLENKIFTKLGKKGTESAPAQLNKKFFALEKAKDKDDYIIYSKKTGKLYYDADGSGSKAAVEIATLSKKLAMTNKDFFVV